ncbi:MAG: type II toxin-antitoxin system RelE/ParE family toxin [Achromobacter sp.]|nr:type II toxin-antitoxin system RelE/ParE family toxin [Achromobacter sp.]
MIIGFRHKGLELFYRTGSTRGIYAAHANKLRQILTMLDTAREPQDMNLPWLRLHMLKGNLATHWSVRVDGSWRVTFRLTRMGAELINYQNYH